LHRRAFTLGLVQADPSRSRWTVAGLTLKRRFVLHRFDKMHGLGNDFLILDARTEAVTMTPALARALADRQRGVGCDQLILLGPSESADLRMDIYNADGGRAEACGNAARCVISLTGVGTIESDGGQLRGAIDGAEIEVTSEPPRFAWNEIPLAYPMDTAVLPMAWDELGGPAAINVGNPHLVFFVEAIDAERLREQGPRIEHDPAFPERVNVNLAVMRDDGIELRTWERGAGLTLACGTGACATAVAAIASKRATSPVRVRMAGGELLIDWSPGGPIVMRGPATHVYRGEIDLGTLA
jgi:diaminopimelate epimerase